MPKDKIIAFIDFFYPPFRKLMPEQTFRYAACGGANTILGLALFKILLVYVFKLENVELGFYTLKPHNAALSSLNTYTSNILKSARPKMVFAPPQAA